MFVKHCYLDVLYRQAQIEQIKGMIKIIKQTPKQDCDKYFIQSNTYLNQLFSFADGNRNQVKFLFPHYAKGVKAVNDYFLDSHELDKNFYHAKPYLLYQQAIISLLQELYQKGIAPKDKDYHYFEYLVLRNDTLTTHTNSRQNTTPLNELKNYRDQRVNLEVNVLYTQVNDKVVDLKICDGTILGKTKIKLYIPLNIINQAKIDKAKIDRGAKIRVKKSKSYRL